MPEQRDWFLRVFRGFVWCWGVLVGLVAIACFVAGIVKNTNSTKPKLIEDKIPEYKNRLDASVKAAKQGVDGVRKARDIAQVQLDKTNQKAKPVEYQKMQKLVTSLNKSQQELEKEISILQSVATRAIALIEKASAERNYKDVPNYFGNLGASLDRLASIEEEAKKIVRKKVGELPGISEEEIWQRRERKEEKGAQGPE